MARSKRKQKKFFNHSETLEVTKFFVEPFLRVVEKLNIKEVMLRDSLVITCFKNRRRKVKIVSRCT